MNEEKTLSMRETWLLARRALAHAQMLRKSALPVALLRAAVLALAPFIPLYVSAWVLNALYAGMAARGVITGALAGAAVECAALTLQAVLQKMHQFNDDASASLPTTRSTTHSS